MPTREEARGGRQLDAAVPPQSSMEAISGWKLLLTIEQREQAPEEDYTDPKSGEQGGKIHRGSCHYMTFAQIISHIPSSTDCFDKKPLKQPSRGRCMGMTQVSGGTREGRSSTPRERELKKAARGGGGACAPCEPEYNDPAAAAAWFKQRL